MHVGPSKFIFFSSIQESKDIPQGSAEIIYCYNQALNLLVLNLQIVYSSNTYRQQSNKGQIITNPFLDSKNMDLNTGERAARTTLWA